MTRRIDGSGRRVVTEQVKIVEARRNRLVDFLKAEPFWSFLIIGSICAAAVEIVAIIFLHHTVEINF